MERTEVRGSSTASPQAEERRSILVCLIEIFIECSINDHFVSTEKIKKQYDEYYNELGKSYPRIKPIFVIIGIILFLLIIAHAAYLSMEPEDRQLSEIIILDLGVIWLTILVFGIGFGFSLLLAERHRISIGYYTKRELPYAKKKMLKFSLLFIISVALFLLTLYLSGTLKY